MKIEKRKNKIMDIIEKNGTVKVSSLSKTLNVSEVTVRSYLADMESKGLLTRVHGGAIYSYKPYYSMNLNQRLETNRKQKEKIAKRAAMLIRPNDTIMLNAGTTTLLVFRQLPQEYNLNIVTNSISIALEGVANPNFNVVLIGGTLNSKYQFTYGENATEMLKNYHANKVILSVDGIDSEKGFSTYYDEETFVDRTMLSQAENCIVVADSTKFGRSAFSKISDLDVADFLVTDFPPSKNEEQNIEKYGIDLIYA